MRLEKDEKDMGLCIRGINYRLYQEIPRAWGVWGFTPNRTLNIRRKNIKSQANHQFARILDTQDEKAARA